MPDRRAFRLDQVLRHEQQQEEIKQRELSALAQQRRLAHEALQTLVRQSHELRDSFSGRRAGQVDAAELEATGTYLEAIAESIRTHEDVMRQLEEQVLGSREELVGILKRRQMLERLRDRQAAEHAVEDGRREQRESDDLTSGRTLRQSREAR